MPFYMVTRTNSHTDKAPSMKIPHVEKNSIFASDFL